MPGEQTASCITVGERGEYFDILEPGDFDYDIEEILTLFLTCVVTQDT